MAEPDDVGIDKQKILKSVASAGKPAPSAAPAPSPVPAAAAPAAAPPVPMPSARRRRDIVATVVLFMVGAPWLAMGIFGSMKWASLLGGAMIAVSLLSFVLLAGRRR
ncbi:MAG: hypothetical protein HYY17_11835 [Planctomycetes bacterium]|nr:hypothetical protein [Planctomycetota bacterium]